MFGLKKIMVDPNEDMRRKLVDLEVAMEGKLAQARHYAEDPTIVEKGRKDKLIDEAITEFLYLFRDWTFAAGLKSDGEADMITEQQMWEYLPPSKARWQAQTGRPVERRRGMGAMVRDPELKEKQRDLRERQRRARLGLGQPRTRRGGTGEIVPITTQRGQDR